MILTENFDDPILYVPALKNGSACDCMNIVTGYIDCERFSSHIINLSEGMQQNIYSKNLTVNVIVGMAKTSGGISLKKHNALLRFLSQISCNSDMPKVSCYYVYSGKNVHSKVYMWLCAGRPQIAYCGSLNYTNNAFYKQREMVSDCDASKALLYYESILRDSLPIGDSKIQSKIASLNAEAMQRGIIFEEDEDKDYEFYNKQIPIAINNVSLLVGKGDRTGYGSGVNWGIRPNGTKRDLDQAYIPYNKDNKVKGFFPDKINPNDKNCPYFRVITSDYGSFHMRMAQANNKALHSVECNAIIGKWLRDKLKVPSGTFITKEMLEAYGKTYVTFRKFNDNTYLLDY